VTRRQASWAATAAATACLVAAVWFLVAGSLGGGRTPKSRSRVTPASAPASSSVATSQPRRPGKTSRPSSVAVSPALFQPGQCQLLYPTKGARHITVFLDAGHGGLDPGAVGQTELGKVVHEADLTLAVELDAATLLRERGFSVVVSRTRNALVGRLPPSDFAGKLLTSAGVRADIAARDRCADLSHAQALVGIYFDAGYSPSNAGSLTAYGTARPFWRSSLRLAQFVQRDVLSALNSHGWGIPNDGVVPDKTLGGPPLGPRSAAYGHLLLLGPGVPGWFTTPSEMPGALIEPLFITDPFEATVAASTTGQHAIAFGVAEAIEQYFRAT